ncbi:outer envelope pore protein 16-4, chloroplastic isoform X2 [Eutrema salsugineum]|uniref:outer envelope pore protein 16-4, chloroplastic isoform X2 n=1 Tax=Eutrema salsugineum TaxID=72664 RepID=UPI000CECF4C0|nr:outer envelope pore protein 16-4, chloroplastic isoform X2 [Eutrema salsugineum]
MEEELLSAVPCSSLAVESVLRVSTAGGLYGFCAGPRDARRIGLSGLSQASYVAKSVGRIGFQCGIVSGIFTMTHCGLQRYRGECFGRRSCGRSSCCYWDKKLDPRCWHGWARLCF